MTEDQADDFAQYERRVSNPPTLGRGWLPLSTGPQDGSLVEMECRYGVKPWRRIVKWTGAEWRSWPDFDRGPFAIGTCWWRPYNGEPSAHRDPYMDIDSFDYYCGKRPKKDEPVAVDSPTHLPDDMHLGVLVVVAVLACFAGMILKALMPL